MITLFADQTSVVGWSNTINTYGVLGLAALQALTMWWAKRNHERTQVVVKEVKDTTIEIKKSVDGPLGTALNTAASAQEALARLTQDPIKILEAVAARKISDDHNANQALLLAAQQKTEAEKQAIIAEFLKDQKTK